MATKLKLQPNGFIYLIHWTSKKVPVKISTKIRIKPEDWNKKAGKLINTRLKDVNGKSIDDQIKKCEGAFLFAIDEYKAGRTTDIVKTYYERMNITVRVGGVNAPKKFLDYFEDRVKEFEVKKTSNHGDYRTAYINLSAFLGRKRPTFEDIDVQFFEDFVDYLKTIKKYRVGSIRAMVKLTRAIINKAYIKEVHSNIKHKLYTLEEAEEIDNIYLSLDELERIYTLDLSKYPELEDTRNSFIVGSFTGLRFCDWGKVRSDMIKEDNTIKILPQKTKKKVNIPVHKHVTAILNKYNGKMPDQLWNADANKQIKTICQLAKINDLVIKEYKQGTETKGSEPVMKHTLVTTHTARRSLITNMLNEKAPIYAVMAVSGHKTLGAFQKYIKSTEEDITKALKELPMFGGKPKGVSKPKINFRQPVLRDIEKDGSKYATGELL